MYLVIREIKVFKAAIFDMDGLMIDSERLTLDVVRRYCPNGIFNAKFSGGANKKTIEECKIELEKYVESDTISYEKLYELSKEIYEIRRNVLAFLREMVYEDMPFTKHPDIDEECSRVLGY